MDNSDVGRILVAQLKDDNNGITNETRAKFQKMLLDLGIDPEVWNPFRFLNMF